MDKIRIGIVGATPEGGWAASAHVPALQGLPAYDLTAVSTTREESAQEAARRFGAPHAFTDARRLAEHPEVDLVVITVKVPFHLELAQAALAAGKHVYCEWPLVRTTSEAETLAAAAEAAGVHHVIGLQARYAPAVEYARQLIADGYLGRLTSATVYAARGRRAAAVPERSFYTFDRRNGAGLLEVGGGHTLDALEHLTSEIVSLSAQTSVQNPTYTVIETGETGEVTSPDQVLLNATLTDGAVASVHLHDAKLTEARTRIELAGTEGDLAIVSVGPVSPMGVQIGELRLFGSQGPHGSYKELRLPAFQEAPPAALHVARLYTALAEDLRAGTRTLPDFHDGLRLHRLLDTVRHSAKTGTRQSVGGA